MHLWMHANVHNLSSKWACSRSLLAALCNLTAFSPWQRSGETNSVHSSRSQLDTTLTGWNQGRDGTWAQSPLQNISSLMLRLIRPFVKMHVPLIKKCAMLSKSKKVGSLPEASGGGARRSTPISTQFPIWHVCHLHSEHGKRLNPQGQSMLQFWGLDFCFDLYAHNLY